MISQWAQERTVYILLIPPLIYITIKFQVFQTMLIDPNDLHWISERCKTELQVDGRGFHDIRWDESDRRLAICSGAPYCNANVYSVSMGKNVGILSGHKETVKCVTWDPQHQELLCMGGRDDAIYLWDLRVRDGTARSSKLSPVLTVSEAVSGQYIKKIQQPLSAHKAVTKILYDNAQLYRIINSSSCDGEVFRLRKSFLQC